MLEEILGIVAGAYTGLNFIAVPIGISKDVEKAGGRREYEKKIKEDKSFVGRFDYYLTYLGRQFSYNFNKAISP